MDYFTDLEQVIMADNVFYSEDIKEEPQERPRSLSLSITKPDWTSMLNTGERSVRITDTLLDTPEILSQCVDWQLHRQPEADVQQYQLPESDEMKQITAIKNELESDFPIMASPQVVVEASTSPVHYYQDQGYLEDTSSRAGDGSISPALSEAQSSMVADDEGDDDTWYPSTRRPGRPRSNNSTSTSSGRGGRKQQKRKLSDVDKYSEEYKEKRKRNNIAVRKSRDKAKRHHVEIEERNNDLEKENGDLRKQNESLAREVSVLRKLITDIGRPIPNNLAQNLNDFSV